MYLGNSKEKTKTERVLEIFDTYNIKIIIINNKRIERDHFRGPTINFFPGTPLTVTITIIYIYIYIYTDYKSVFRSKWLQM